MTELPAGVLSERDDDLDIRAVGLAQQDCRCHVLAGAMVLDSGHCDGCGRRVVAELINNPSAFILGQPGLGKSPALAEQPAT